MSAFGAKKAQQETSRDDHEEYSYDPTPQMANIIGHVDINRNL